jgi:hypothetical protein
MQASDRRVTVLGAADEVVGRRDERNKAIFVAERMTFAYTGHADIGGSDTAEWFQALLGRALSQGRSFDDALEEAAEMAAQYFRALPPRARRPFIVCLSTASKRMDGGEISRGRTSTRTERCSARTIRCCCSPLPRCSATK